MGGGGGGQNLYNCARTFWVRTKKMYTRISTYSVSFVVHNFQEGLLILLKSIHVKNKCEDLMWNVMYCNLFFWGGGGGGQLCMYFLGEN